jgi:hypothetical protein
MASRFYFNTRDDVTELDPDGTELDSIAEAQEQALILVGRMLTDGHGHSVWKGKPLVAWVTDGPNGTGNVFFKLQVSEAKTTDTN